MVESKFTAMVL